MPRGIHEMIAILRGWEIQDIDEGEKLSRQYSFYLLFNADSGKVSYRLPANGAQNGWSMVLDTANPSFQGDLRLFQGGQAIAILDHSMVVFQSKQVNESTLNKLGGLTDTNPTLF